MNASTFTISDRLTAIADRYNSGKWVWDQRESDRLDSACVLMLDSDHWLSDHDIYQLAFIRHELERNQEPEWMAWMEGNL